MPRRNLDPLTETYGLNFYFTYLARWPEYFTVAEAASGSMMGYSESSLESHRAVVLCWDKTGRGSIKICLPAAGWARIGTVSNLTLSLA